MMYCFNSYTIFKIVMNQHYRMKKKLSNDKNQNFELKIFLKLLECNLYHLATEMLLVKIKKEKIISYYFKISLIEI